MDTSHFFHHDTNTNTEDPSAVVPPHLMVRRKSQTTTEVIHPPLHGTMETNTKKEEQDFNINSTKAWILQQYEFEEDYDHEEDDEEEEQLVDVEGKNRRDNDRLDNDDGDVAEKQRVKKTGGITSTESASKTPPTASAQSSSQSQSPTAAAAAAAAVVVDPNEKRLKEMEEQLQQQEADLNDDASNYMRSKLEIKQLKISTKNLRQQVKGLRKKVEKTKDKAQAAAQQDAASSSTVKNGERNHDEQDGIMMGGGFFGSSGESDDEYDEEGAGGVFDQTRERTAVNTPPTVTSRAIDRGELEGNSAPPSDPVVPKDSVPSGWTGKTPREILEDWCRKEKVRVRFFKLNCHNGARVNVDTKPVATSKTTDNYMGSFRDAQEYLATKVLYQLNPDLPLYRLFPPFHRDLWKSWSESVRNEKKAVQQQVNDAIASKIRQLVDSVTKTRLQGDAGSTQNSNNVALPAAPDEPVRESWDDDVNNDFGNIAVPREQKAAEPTINGSLPLREKHQTRPTHSGEEIRKKFLMRQETPEYQKMLKDRRALPMYAFREQVLKTIKENPVTILCAEVSPFFVPVRCCMTAMITSTCPLRFRGHCFLFFVLHGRPEVRDAYCTIGLERARSRLATMVLHTAYSKANNES